jgi:hypothetical protein
VRLIKNPFTKRLDLNGVEWFFTRCIIYFRWARNIRKAAMAKFADKLSQWILSKFIYLWLFLVLLIASLIGIAFVQLPLSDAIQALFLAIQSLLMFGLVLVTWWYARETAKMSKSSEGAAKAAAEQAEATKKMAEEMRQQRLSASQPVVWPMIWGWSANLLEVIFENIGNGPALDVDVYLGRGEEPIIRDSEHRWYSYIVAGAREKANFLKLPGSFGATGLVLDSNLVSELVGEYTLLVEWRDLHMSGPFFRAKLPFRIEMDSSGRPLVKEGVVNIEPIYVKIKPS